MPPPNIRSLLNIGLVGIIFALVSGPGAYLLDRFRVLGLTRWRTMPASFSPITSEDSTTHYLTDAIGCEDLHHHAGSGMLFAACQEGYGKRKEWFPPLEMWKRPPVWKEGAGDGTLVMIDPKTLEVTHLTLHDFNLPFITHGIDIFDSPTSPGSIYIHAVNHFPNPAYLSLSPSDRAKFTLNKASSQIEVFHYVLGSKTATHIRSIAHELINTPNDIQSIGPGEFYVTNDHKHREGGLRGLEDVGGAKWAAWTDTVLVRAGLPAQGLRKPEPTGGASAEIALSGMHNNNGLGRTDDPQEIVINSAAGGVTTIGRKPFPSDPSHNITVIDTIHLPTTLDNPSWYTDLYADEKTGDASGLIMAGLAQALPYLATHDHHKASGVVWHVRPRAGTRRNIDGKREWEKPKAIFKSDGEEIEMVTTAVLVGIDPAENRGRKQGKLFVTSPFGKSIVVRTVDL